MLRYLLISAAVSMAVDPVAANCIGRGGQSVDGRAEAHSIGPRKNDFNRYMRLTPGRHTIQVDTQDKGACNNSPGLEFDVGRTPNGTQLRCASDDQEGPADFLNCRITVGQSGTYYIRVRNASRCTISYNLICRNGFHTP